MVPAVNRMVLAADVGVDCVAAISDVNAPLQTPGELTSHRDQSCSALSTSDSSATELYMQQPCRSLLVSRSLLQVSLHGLSAQSEKLFLRRNGIVALVSLLIGSTEDI